MLRFISLFGLMAVFLAACGAGSPARQSANASQMPVVTVFRSPTCGCCEGWVQYMEENGFKVVIEDVQDMSLVKARYRVPAELQSCHTALVDGYVLEGHVPVNEIIRFLKERPDFIGLAVPGMPVGSPGMEVPGSAADPFDVIAFDGQGRQVVYGSYDNK